MVKDQNFTLFNFGTLPLLEFSIMGPFEPLSHWVVVNFYVKSTFLFPTVSNSLLTNLQPTGVWWVNSRACRIKFQNNLTPHSLPLGLLTLFLGQKCCYFPTLFSCICYIQGPQGKYNIQTYFALYLWICTIHSNNPKVARQVLKMHSLKMSLFISPTT